MSSGNSDVKKNKTEKVELWFRKGGLERRKSVTL